MKNILAFSPGGDTLCVDGVELPDGEIVRILVGGEWFEGELELGWIPPMVFTIELGHVALGDRRGLRCIVEELQTLREPP